MAMTNITDVYWEANGISLHTYAWAVETRAGRMAGAAKRGENYQVPFKSGRTRVPKLRESRVQTLPMWVAPVNQDGTRDNTMTAVEKTEENWNFLMSALDISSDFVLKKRFKENGVVKVVTGRAELLDPPDITVVQPAVWRFTLELEMADPWFYGPWITETAGTSFSVEGQVATPKVELEMSAGRMTFPDGNWIEYNGTGVATIDCFEGNAVRGDGTYVNGQVDRHRKFPEWPSLSPGPVTVDGSGTIKYKPAYR